MSNLNVDHFLDSVPDNVVRELVTRSVIDDLNNDFQNEDNRIEFTPQIDFSDCPDGVETTADFLLNQSPRMFREYRRIEANSHDDVYDVLDGRKKFIPLYAPGSGMVNWYLYRSSNGKFWFTYKSPFSLVPFIFKRVSKKQIREELLSEYNDEPDLELPPKIIAHPI